MSRFSHHFLRTLGVGTLGLTALLFFSGGALAEGDALAFPGLFGTPPCADGWMGCLVNGQATGAGSRADAAGRPQSPTLRLGWWDLQPTAAISPFTSLSQYNGAVGGSVAAPPEPTPEQVAVATPPPTNTNLTNTPPGNNPVNNLPVNTPPPNNPVNNPPISTPPPVATPAATPAATPVPTPVAVTTPVPTPTKPTLSPATPTPSTPGMVVKTNPPDNSCDDLVVMEPTALMGQLSSSQIGCLENRVATESSQTTRDKVSRLLINNAYAKGDKTSWAKLVKRHLEDIDRSDPDMCYNYALHLSRQGAGSASSVIKWSDYALENKARWQGNTYKSRVYALMKMKAEAASRLWESAEKSYNESRSDEDEAKAAKYRGMAKEYSREWLDYARASGQDTSTAMSLCVSAAGNQAFCQGG